jgi:hypothetical protein
MLDKCAPKHRIELKTHNFFVYYDNLTYPSLPKYDEVEAGHVKKLCRALGIYECAKKFLKF